MTKRKQSVEPFWPGSSSFTAINRLRLSADSFAIPFIQSNPLQGRDVPQRCSESEDLSSIINHSEWVKNNAYKPLASVSPSLASRNHEEGQTRSKSCRCDGTVDLLDSARVAHCGAASLLTPSNSSINSLQPSGLSNLDTIEPDCLQNYRTTSEIFHRNTALNTVTAIAKYLIPAPDTASATASCNTLDLPNKKIGVLNSGGIPAPLVSDALTGHNSDSFSDLHEDACECYTILSPFADEDSEAVKTRFPNGKNDHFLIEADYPTSNHSLGTTASSPAVPCADKTKLGELQVAKIVTNSQTNMLRPHTRLPYEDPYIATTSDDRQSEVVEYSQRFGASDDHFDEELPDEDLLSLSPDTAPVKTEVGLSNLQVHGDRRSFKKAKTLTATQELAADQSAASSQSYGHHDDLEDWTDNAKEAELQDFTSSSATPDNAAYGKSFKLDWLDVTELQVALSALQTVDRMYNENTSLRKPIVRPSFPTQARDGSPVLGLSPDTLLRTCFRVAEAYNSGCNAIQTRQNTVLELYARVVSSRRERNSPKQHFLFADLFHSRPPFLEGLYELWQGVELCDYDSSMILEPVACGRKCRCIGRMKRDGKNWKLIVLNVWEASWEDIEYVEGIVCAQGL